MKTAVQFGLITGVASSLWTYISYVLDYNSASFGGAGGFIPFLILFIGIGIGIFFRRRSEEFGANILSFKEGARTGVIISAVAGLCLAAYSMLNGLVINPEYLREYMDAVREYLEKENTNAAEIEKQMKEIRESFSVGMLMFSQFMVTLIIGIVGSFLLAAMLKKDPEY